MNNFIVKELHSEKHSHLPSVNLLFILSLGLIFFTLISFTLVYAETISVDVQENSFDVNYTVTGMTITGIDTDIDIPSLILYVDVTGSSATLNITFDRTFFDSTFKGLDDDFFILADDDEANFSEIETSTQSRTLNIKVPVGTEVIEIIGSSLGDSTIVVPDTPDTDTDATTAKAIADAATAKIIADAATAKAIADAATAKAIADAATAKAIADAATAKAIADASANNTPPIPPCGPGTVLQDDACVLDERCGPGTVFQNGVCILDSAPQPPSSSVNGMGKDLVMGLIVAFGVAGIVGVVFALISKANKNN